MIPPTRSHLQALAGWSLTMRHNSSDRQHMALCHFGDACGELADVIEELPGPVRLSSSPTPTSVAQVDQSHVMAEQTQIVPSSTSIGPCAHRFHIKTQCCVYCGMTYLKAHGRKPELM